MQTLRERVAGWPEALAERVRLRPEDARPRDGRFVVYWMRTAVRAHENPALDAALRLGRELGVPTFVYHGLDERYPWASDRHHRFILEGARDVAAELAERGVAHAFHLSRPGHRGPHLLELAARACALVTEDMPVGFLERWTGTLAERAGAPLVRVDTACVVPMRLVPRAFDRAFAFRRVTETLRRERVARPWTEEPVERPAFLPELPFEPLDLAAADLDELVAACEIDHDVAPVPETPGGSVAGYARWRAFREQGLRSYHRRRNDPLRDATSRLSPYLHYGHVSPLRVAREAHAQGSEGGAKFLDELLVWRELAYAWCFHRPDHDRVSSLPDWARRTLAEHEGDPRPQQPSWETLARARTGDPLWDAAQRSLRIHGELHNNVRMTWGKALIGWSRDAEQALRRLEDLNHRYALDGRDPASYGGILWCLGLFDRPFLPERPILGSVRERSTASHARRLDVARYAERVGRPAVSEPASVAVVGAGIAGLACARSLADHGLQVRVFDRGRGAGGRTSTRRTEHGAFDHGAQYFTVRDPHFARHVASWEADGLVAPWKGRVGALRQGEFTSQDPKRRYVGVPGMSAVARHLAADLDLETRVHVERVAPEEGGWRIASEAGDHGGFDAIALATAAPQALPLLAAAPALAARVSEVEMAPCLATLVRFEGRLDVPFDGAFVTGSPLAWVARDASKPGRGEGDVWVLHAGPAWSAAHIGEMEARPERVADALLEAFAEVLGAPLPRALYRAAHRWRFARVTKPLTERCLYDRELRLGWCGDGCGGDRIESAWRSGVALAGRILAAAAPPARAPSQAALPL